MLIFGEFHGFWGAVAVVHTTDDTFEIKKYGARSARKHPREPSVLDSQPDGRGFEPWWRRLAFLVLRMRH